MIGCLYWRLCEESDDFIRTFWTPSSLLIRLKGKKKTGTRHQHCFSSCKPIICPKAITMTFPSHWWPVHIHRFPDVIATKWYPMIRLTYFILPIDLRLGLLLRPFHFWKCVGCLFCCFVLLNIRFQRFELNPNGTVRCFSCTFSFP